MSDLIEKLSNLRSQFNCFDENERDAYNTLSEAIKVLSEQPEPCEDAVSRQAAIDAVNSIDNLDAKARGGIWFKLMSVPSAQPEIIRCKDCKYGEQDDIGRWFCNDLGCQIGSEDGSGYCANAERKTDD